jgi:hypothetical protein
VQNNGPGFDIFVIKPDSHPIFIVHSRHNGLLYKALKDKPTVAELKRYKVHGNNRRRKKKSNIINEHLYKLLKHIDLALSSERREHHV